MIATGLGEPNSSFGRMNATSTPNNMGVNQALNRYPGQGQPVVQQTVRPQGAVDGLTGMRGVNTTPQSQVGTHIPTPVVPRPQTQAATESSVPELNIKMPDFMSSINKK